MSIEMIIILSFGGLVIIVFAVAITRLVRTVRRFKIGQAVAETEAKPTEPFSFQLDHATDWPGS